MNSSGERQLKGRLEAPTMKVVGRQGRSKGGLIAAAGFLELVVALRCKKPFIPKGVHRFKSFEEANAWNLRMMTRR